MHSSYPFKELQDFGTWIGGGTPSKANRAYWTSGTFLGLSRRTWDAVG